MAVSRRRAYTNISDAITFPDGNSALMLVTARLKYIVEHEWSKRRYLDMSKLEEMDELRGRRRARRGRSRGRLNQFAKES